MPRFLKGRFAQENWVWPNVTSDLVYLGMLHKHTSYG
jgi:hypothetical protein